MEQSIAEAEPSSEDHRRNMHLVWQELGVGREGYLTLEELASVCERIGMEEMNGEVRVAVEMRETVGHCWKPFLSPGICWKGPGNTDRLSVLPSIRNTFLWTPYLSELFDFDFQSWFQQLSGMMKLCTRHVVLTFS